MVFKKCTALMFTLVLTACGGGGGGSAPGTTSSASVIPTTVQTIAVLGAKILAGTFAYYRDGSTSTPVSFMYARDINKDGVDEVFFVAFESQPNTQANYSNTSVHIFGWENNVFKEITSTWLPGISNQVEGVGDLVFGDFNGDGKIDVFLSSYTDMDFDTNAYALMNTGSSFTKVTLGPARWQHAVASADINRDGFDDVIVAGYSGNSPQYMGSSTGLVQYSGMIGSSGVAVGDFLGTGTAQAVFVDAGSGSADSFIYTMTVNNTAKQITFTKTVTLPAPRLAVTEDSTNRSHDVRTRAVDFDSDGRLDIVIFSYKANYTRSLLETEYKSEIQFLRNTGNGVFVDVTDTVRSGYDTTGYSGYYPEFRDFNGDGKLDLFLSQPDYFSSRVHRSTTLLIQQANGTYKDTGKSDFVGAIDSQGGHGLLAKGPAGKTYLVTESAWARTSFTTVYVQPVNF